MLTEGMAGFVAAWETIAVPAADLEADTFYTGAAIGYSADGEGNRPERVPEQRDAADN
ncbi:MAG: hypothetical protein R3B99_31020 [Polyangiales bacterium]